MLHTDVKLNPNPWLYGSENYEQLKRLLLQDGNCRWQNRESCGYHDP